MNKTWIHVAVALVAGVTMVGVSVAAAVVCYLLFRFDDRTLGYVWTVVYMAQLLRTRWFIYRYRRDQQRRQVYATAEITAFCCLAALVLFSLRPRPALIAFVLIAAVSIYQSQIVRYRLGIRR